MEAWTQCPGECPVVSEITEFMGWFNSGLVGVSLPGSINPPEQAAQPQT